MTKDEALKLALETLEYAGPSWIDARQPAITAIKEALAQPEQDGKCKYCTDGCPACDARKLPEQEPVAWLHIDRLGGEQAFTNEPPPSLKAQCQPLYTTPPQRPSRSDIKPLTDEETYKIQTSVGYSGGFSRFVVIVRAIEAAHGIKGKKPNAA